MSIAANILPGDAEQIIYATLRKIGIDDVPAKIITAQSGHETDGWTSNVWKQDNNGFGFGYDGAGGYFMYSAIEDSVYALVSWIADKQAAGSFPELRLVTDPSQYAQLLKSNGYFTDSVSNYLAGLNRWYNNNLVFAGTVSLVAAIGLFLFVFFTFKKK